MAAAQASTATARSNREPPAPPTDAATVIPGTPMSVSPSHTWSNASGPRFSESLVIAAVPVADAQSALAAYRDFWSVIGDFARDPNQDWTSRVNAVR